MNRPNPFIGFSIAAMLLIMMACCPLTSIIDNIKEGISQIDPQEIQEQLDIPEVMNEAEQILEGVEESLSNETEQIHSAMDLSGLDSYRLNIVIQYEGRDDSGNPILETSTITEEINNQQNAIHIIMISESPDTPKVELFTIDSTTYIYDPSDADFNCFSFTGEDETVQEFNQMINPEDVFEGAESQELVKKGEVINGIMTDHYRVIYVDPETDVHMTEAGDIWIAQDGGFIVKFVGQLKGSFDTTSFDEMEGTMNIQYELSDVNQIGEIVLPAECSAENNESMFPIPENATEVTQFAGFTTYSSPDEPDALLEYYQAELTNSGWALGDISRMATIITFTATKDGTSSQFMITPGDEGGALVVITLVE
jgi:hypothetical protein